LSGLGCSPSTDSGAADTVEHESEQKSRYPCRCVQCFRL